MTSVPFVRALSLVGFHAFAARQGLDPARMLKQIGLSLQSLQDEDNLFPYQQYCALLQACSQQSGNPLFGLHYGLFQASSVFGDLLHVLRNARTVGDALLELRNHYGLYNAAAQVGLDSENGQVILSYHVHQADAPGVRQAEELACAAGMQLMRALLGSHWRPGAIWLRHSAGADTTLYAQALGMPVTFDAPGLALVFESSVLALPCATCDEALHQLVVRNLQRLEPLCSDELSGQLKQLLQHLLPSGRATAQKVASIMALTPDQLRQAMAREGLSFQQLLEDVRQRMAHAYLARPSVDIGELARLLGYADTSGFCRAFHRWHNMSPLNWQKAQGIQRQPRLLGRGRKRL